MDRRRFLVTSLAGVLVGPPAVRAQQASSLPRVGILSISSRESSDTLAPQNVLQQALRDLGYVEGQSVILEYRWADGKVERLRELAAELVRLDVDVIVAGSTPGARAARQATSTIPIVSPAMGDPVGDGLVASLARPGGNVTGSTFLGPNLIAKRLELLKEALPRVARLGILWHPGAFAESTMRAMLNEAETVAGNLGMRLHFAPVRDADDLGRAFVTIEAERTDALFVFDSVMLFTLRPQIVVLATKHRLPSMFNNREAVELGALMSYGVSILDLIRRGAVYVDRIIKGAKPSDLPVEQPTKFELIINLRTAKILGLTIPRLLLLRADQLIE